MSDPIRTVGQHFLSDGFDADCSCGWTSTGHSTQAAAEHAIARHARTCSESKQ